jgi:hypothetical protein
VVVAGEDVVVGAGPDVLEVEAVLEVDAVLGACAVGACVGVFVGASTGGGGAGATPAAWPELPSTISPDSSTASKSEPWMAPRRASTSLFQRSSGTPVMNHGDPLSATMTP